MQTELSNVTDIVNRLAISHPNIAFRLVHDGNQLLRTAGNGDLKQTLAGIYGVATAKKMREIKKKIWILDCRDTFLYQNLQEPVGTICLLSLMDDILKIIY